MRVVPLDDAHLFVISRSRALEPHAMVGFLLDPEGRSPEFRATDFLPRNLVRPNTAGQIYGAALLDDGRLALSIGWTNSKGRNINGIALLERGAERWQPDRVIVMRGSVRDIAAAPRGGIVAVTTDLARGTDRAVLSVLVMEPSGRIRSRLHERFLSVEEAEREALAIRVQRAGNESVAIFDVPGGAVHVLELRPLASCESSVVVREDGLAYPRYGRANCDAVSLARLLSLSDVPAEAQELEGISVEGFRLHRNGSFTVAQHGFDGRTTNLVVTTYGRNANTISVPRVIGRSAVIGEDFIEAVTLDRGAVKRIRLPIR